MACGLRTLPVMPVDTLLPLGTSPPLPSLLLSHRYTATSVMYIADQSAIGRGRPAARPKKLRPCIRDAPTTNRKGESAGQTHPNSILEASCTNLDAPDSTTNGHSLTSRIPEVTAKSSGKSRKRVCFADDKGHALREVRIMDGPSFMPPLLKSRILQEIVQDERPGLFPTYTYVADFEQPAADYLEFRNKLERSLVSLENVVVQDNESVMGTIKVKNIAFEKKVAVRATFNKWNSYLDIPASYVAGSPSAHKDRYDTFSFAFDIPPNMEGDSFEFCIHYTCGGKTHWDSREGRNYRIVSQHERSLTEEQKMASYYSLSSKANWGEFSFWKVKADERPYW